MKKVLILGFYLLTVCAAGAQGADQTLRVAKSFLGVPYQSGTLEQSGPERLVTNLQAMDCWTFVEQSLALALSESSGRPWTEHLQALRYRRGVIDGYGSRIHYFLEWGMQAEAGGLLRDVTRELGGIPYAKSVAYMSQNPEKYPRLSEPGAMEAVRQAEGRINARAWFYIPKAQIAGMERQLRDGDVVATTAAQPLLDVSHQGFVLRENGRAYLLHASSREARVVVTGMPLSEYVMGNKDQTGIVVFRP